MPTVSKDELERAILTDVVTRFVNLRESTRRRDLLIKYRGSNATDVIANLGSRYLIRKVGNGVEEYLPTSPAFEYCDNTELRQRAKFALTVVLHTLQNMWVGEQKDTGYGLEDLKRHVRAIYPNREFDDETLRLGLYLAQDFGVLGGLRYNEPNTEVTWFQIGERAITMENPEAEWDRIMAGYRPPWQQSSSEDLGTSLSRKESWEKIRPLGSGGQSDVYLVRSPERVAQRIRLSKTIETALGEPTIGDEDHRPGLADAILAYGREDSLDELGALKVFKIPVEGSILTPLPGSAEYEAIQRLTNEISVLQQNRNGLPKLLDSNIAERWIITEYFPQQTLEQHPLQFRGNARGALRAFRSLVETVAFLHDDSYIHRDIKPANVFIRNDDELVLGDFGIVYVPNAPDRVTMLEERVGPRDYMPQWANLGVRYENVTACVDVYMLGKLLWSMISGRAVLPREYHHEPEFDLTKVFRDEIDMYLINRILDKCIVERSNQCLSSARDLLLVVDEVLSIMKRNGQLLSPDVPRHCHICGKGQYQAQSFGGRPVGTLRIWNSGGATDISSLTVELFSCDSCGHVEFFRAPAP